MKLSGVVLPVTALAVNILPIHGGLLSQIGNLFSGSPNEPELSLDNDLQVHGDLISHHARNLVGSGTFQPNSCAPSACSAFSSLFTGPSIASEVSIGCDVCVDMSEYTAGEELHFAGGLNIIGEMKFPAGTKVTIRTPYIFVQGKLVMSSDAVVTGTPDVKIILTGTHDIMFKPASPNTANCPVDGCNVGTKPIVVAGGSLDISGLPEGCPAWSIMEDDGSRIMPLAESYPQQEPVGEGCSAILSENDFSTSASGWFGNLGASADISGGTLKVGNRKADWQGPMVEIRESDRGCIVNDTTYVFTMKARLSAADGNSTSECSASGEGCLQLTWTHMDVFDRVIARPMATMDSAIAVADGEWFTFAGDFVLRNNMISTDDVFSALTITGPEAGIDIEIDDVYIGLPPTSLYPDPTAVCKNLVMNGNPEQGFMYPFKKYDFRSEPSIHYADGNAYFHVTKRDRPFSTLSTELITDCMVDQSIYSFSAKLWLHSAEPVVARAMIKTYLPEGSPEPAVLEKVALCPPSSEEIGWVECETDFVFRAEHKTAEKVELLFITGDDKFSDLDTDDISFTFKAGPPGSGLKVKAEASTCWGVGSGILITPQAINFNEEQLATIQSIEADGTIRTEEQVKAPTPESKWAKYASSFALLSRNIVFEAEANPDDPLTGGHLIVMRTPSAQKLDGVGFINFGQQGKKGFYPIHLYQGGNSDAIISRNLIMNSNSRAVVLAGVQGAKVTGNVGYNVFGHCYAMEDGSEVQNTISNNLAVKIMRASKSVPLENDHSPSGILIKNPKNTVEDNVVAGSQDSGIWFELDTIIMGDSIAAGYAENPSAAVITSFNRNKIHSCMGDGLKTFPKGLNPSSPTTMYNTISFRNRGNGISLKGSKNIIIHNAIIADNKVGIAVENADNIEIKNAWVFGYSNSFKEKAEALVTAPRHCWGASAPLIGVKLYPNVQTPGDSGATLTNVKFAGFTDDLGCPGSVGIVVDDNTENKEFTATTKFVDVTAAPGYEGENILSLCDAQTAVIHDIKIQDNGALNPGNTSTPGFIVSDNEVMTSIAGTCHEMEGGCAQYCYGECLRKVTIGLDSAGTEEFILELKDGNGVTSNIQGVIGEVTGDSWAERRYYVADLPIGTGAYTAKFMKNGVIDWPIFAEVDIEDEPICSPYWTDFDLEVPPPEEGACDNLVRNGDFDLEEGGSLAEWHHTGGGIKIVPGITGSALSTVERWGIMDGFAQYIDTRCLVAGTIHKFRAMTKLWNPFDMPVCDPNFTPLGGDRCPRVSIKSVPREGETTYHFDIGVQAGPYHQGKWNKMYGVFKVTEDMVNASSVVLFVDGVRDSEEIIIDDVSILPIEKECNDNLMRNGDLETGDTMWWRFIGPHTGITMVENVVFGAGNSGWSARTNLRQFYFHGPTQMLNTECVTPDNWYEVSGKYRMVTNKEEFYACDPYHGYVGALTCPSVQLRFLFGFNETFRDIGLPIGPFKDNDWNEMYGVFQADNEVLEADTAEVFIANAMAYINIIFDDIVVKPATADTYGVPSCNELVQNGDAEIGDARFWKIKGTSDYGTIEMVTPGADGSQYAFHHTGHRARNFNGLWQYLDQRCMEIGSKWKVTAKFKLFDDTGKAVTCDRNTGGGVDICPQILIQSTTLGTPYHTGPLRSTDKTPWVADQWNNFEAVFVMDEGHKIEDRTWFFIHNVNIGYTYMIDNLSIAKM